MLKKLLFSASIFTFTISFAQKLRQAPWQQRVDYTITVSLDDVNNILRGNESMQYTNNSPDVLNEMYIHLWPNAYKNNETAFARQLVENGNTRFFYASENQLGWIDSLNFTVNGVPVKWELTADIDIAKITLSQPVNPGSTITLATPFKVKMPEVFSRMGQEGQLYCATQWYPKPAVYDVNGWNPMPYLDQGEFYSEFGKFDVQITIPQNYVVAATGVLQNEEEKQWLLSKVKFTPPNTTQEGDATIEWLDTPPSSEIYKTIRFVQDSIHDFAWFADKRFRVDTSSVVLPNSGRRVQTWFYHIRSFDTAVKEIDTALTFYSKMVGDYPYSHASVVVTPLYAGSGMEYPMITNMTLSDKQVIIHEIGHNWFYGILATNEREYPWMDESINNYYETRSTENELLKEPPSFGANTTSITREGYPGLDLRFITGARKNEDQASSLPSVDYTDHNYGAIIYGKASSSFHYLQRYLGDSIFDNMMRAYYEKWKFRHPLPQDFISHAEQFTGKDLSWFFDGLMATTYKQNWKAAGIKKVENGYEVKVKNKSQINAPFSITGIKDKSEVTTLWYDSVGSGRFFFPKGEYDYLRIDAFENTTEIDRTNNTIKTKGLFKKSEPLQFRLFGDLENPYRSQLFFSPIIGANLYNKTMTGAAFYNSLYPTSKTEYIIAPMYAFGTQSLVGSAEIQRHFLSYGFAKRITLGLRGSTYASAYFAPTTYTKVEPSIRFELRKRNMRTSADRYILARYIYVNEQYDLSLLPRQTPSSYVDITFAISKNRVFNPYSAKFNYQFGDANSVFQKVSAEATQFITYNKPNKGFTIRIFGGAFLQKPGLQDDRVHYRTSGNTGQFDYLFDQSQFGRGEDQFSNSLFAQQLMPGGAQFSAATPLLGGTDSWITALNLNSTIPGIIPVKLYADAVFVNELTTLRDGNTGETIKSYDLQLYYTGGVRIAVFNDILQINIPFFASGQIMDYWEGRNGLNGISFAERISFVLDLNKMNPVKAFRSAGF